MLPKPSISNCSGLDEKYVYAVFSVFDVVYNLNIVLPLELRNHPLTLHNFYMHLSRTVVFIFHSFMGLAYS